MSRFPGKQKQANTTKQNHSICKEEIVVGLEEHGMWIENHWGPWMTEMNAGAWNGN